MIFGTAAPWNGGPQFLSLTRLEAVCKWRREKQVFDCCATVNKIAKQPKKSMKHILHNFVVKSTSLFLHFNSGSMGFTAPKA
jgi:hypothetical protein